MINMKPLSNNCIYNYDKRYDILRVVLSKSHREYGEEKSVDGVGFVVMREGSSHKMIALEIYNFSMIPRDKIKRVIPKKFQQCSFEFG